MLDKTSQLLERQQLISSGDVLLVNAPDNYPTQLNVRAHYLHWGHYQQSRNDLSCFGAEIDQRASTVVLYVPKEKALALMLLDNLAACMRPDDTLYLVGDNRGGIRALARQLPAPWSPAVKIASGNHCLLFSTQLETQGSFSLENYRTQYSVLAEDTKISAVNFPGVFSQQHLDPGTQLLLQHMPQNIHGSLLDFACGSGLIGTWLARARAVTNVTYSDVSAVALEATRHTLQLNGVEGRVVASDGLTDIHDRFDWIVSNPPFHSGKNTDYTISRRFFTQAKAHLNARGRLLLVANSFLPYPELLREHFTKTVEHANNGRFRVLEAHN